MLRNQSDKVLTFEGQITAITQNPPDEIFEQKRQKRKRIGWPDIRSLTEASVKDMPPSPQRAAHI